MKLIKDKKIFGYINIFDFLFILLIIGLAFASYYRFFLAKDKEVFIADNKLVYTAKIELVDRDIIENLKEKDLIFVATAVRNEYRKIGEITDVYVEPYETLEINLDGTLSKVEHPDYCNVILTINENGKITDRGYYSSSNEELLINSNMNVATKYAEFEMKIQTIEEK